MIVRTLTSVIVANAICCDSQASAETRPGPPLDLAKVNASDSAKKAEERAATAMAYAPEAHVGGFKIPAKKIAIFILGTGGPLFSYMWVGQTMFEKKGYEVRYCASFIVLSFCNLEGADAIVAHSAGGIAAVNHRGAKKVFLIDAFVPAFDTCRAEKCIDIYNSNHIVFGRVKGPNVKSIDCAEAMNGCKFIGHVGMSVAEQVWRKIDAEL